MASGPYPDGSFFAIHKGFRTGMFSTLREFKCHTEGFSGGHISAVFTDSDDANVFYKTGKPPPGVEPLAPHAPGRLNDGRIGASPGHTAAPDPPHVATSGGSTSRTQSSLPTPSASPERSIASSQPARSQAHSASSRRPYSSQPIPSTPRKPVKPEPDSDTDGGDTEPEDETAPLPTSRGPRTPVSGTRTGAPVRQTKSTTTPGAKITPLGRKITAGSISNALRREMSSGTVFPNIKPEPGMTSVSSVGSPSKPSVKSEPAVPTRPSITPDTTPVHTTDIKMRDCTHCSGTGRVACSESESDAPKPTGSKRPAESSTAERRAKRVSDGKRAEGTTKVSADKGKGKARAVEKVALEPRKSFGDRFVIYAVALLVFLDLTDRFLGLGNMLSMLSRFA